MKDYKVEFKYFSHYEDENENYSVNVTEDFCVNSLDELLEMLGLSDDSDLVDLDFDDSEGINFDAESEMIESGRDVICIKDDKNNIVWNKN